MRNAKISLRVIIFCIFFASISSAEDYDLQYFLSKASSKAEELSKKEKMEVLNRIGQTMERAQQIQEKLAQTIQTGDVDTRYQDANFWLSRLEEDKALIQTGVQQLKLLREKPGNLVTSIGLYKSLKDLSNSFSACNNVSSFAAFVGDLAPEMALWADPVFYKLYLLPLARWKEGEMKPVQKEKKSIDKERKR